jgi:hypothetical protein
MEKKNRNPFLVMLNTDMMLWARISNIDFQLIENDLTRTLGWSHSKCEDIIAEYKKYRATGQIRLLKIIFLYLKNINIIK